MEESTGEELTAIADRLDGRGPVLIADREEYARSRSETLTFVCGSRTSRATCPASVSNA